MDQLKVVQEVLADLKISLSYLASFSTVSKKTTLTGRLLICILPDAVHGPVRTKSDEHHRCSHSQKQETAGNKNIRILIVDLDTAETLHKYVTPLNRFQDISHHLQHWLFSSCDTCNLDQNKKKLSLKMREWQRERVMRLRNRFFPKKKEQSTDNVLLVIMYRNFSAGSSGKR